MSKDEADQGEAESKESTSNEEAADEEAEAPNAAAASAEDESDDGESDDDESDDGESDDGESDDDESDDDESDDDESDDDESDDASDDDASDDDESDDDESDDDESAASTAKRGGKGKKKRHGGMTPGERLAAAKARKAKKKLDQRGRQAEVVEDRVIKQASVATEWIAGNRQVLWGAAAAIALVIAGVTFWSMNTAAKAAEASDALWEAVQAANGEIRSEGNVAGAQDQDSEIFDSRQARAEATLERAEQVRGTYPGTPAATWAALEAGTALLDLERWSDARESFETAIAEGGQQDAVTWRALEGVAFAFEGEQTWDEAIQRFNELKTSGDGAFAQVADYHLARMHIAKGETDLAKELLAGLLDSLREREEGAPELDFIRSQTEIRLLELDSSLLPSTATPSAGNPFQGAGGSDPFENIPPELREQLMEQLRQQGAAGGAGGE